VPNACAFSGPCEILEILAFPCEPAAVRQENTEHSRTYVQAARRGERSLECSIMSVNTDAGIPKLLVTAKQAAAALSISERTLWAWTNRKIIACVKIGRSVRYDLRDLAAFIDRAKEGGTR
jgi:hypothetical protein